MKENKTFLPLPALDTNKSFIEASIEYLEQSFNRWENLTDISKKEVLEFYNELLEIILQIKHRRYVELGLRPKTRRTLLLLDILYSYDQINDQVIQKIWCAYSENNENDLEDLRKSVFEENIEYDYKESFSLFRQEVGTNNLLADENEFIYIRSNFVSQQIEDFKLESDNVYTSSDWIKINLLRFYRSYLEFLERRKKYLNKQDVSFEIKLSELFSDISKYHALMTLLVKTGCCQEHTYIWKDSKSGSKGFLAAIIKYLHHQGYYKRTVTNREIELIAQNTFGCIISIDTIKKNNPEMYDLSFIPIATLI